MLYRSQATLQENHILSNTAIYAGGLMLHMSDATLRGNAILFNTAIDSEGGGLALFSSSQAILDGNLIHANRTDECGGGLFNSVGDPTLTNNVIADNHANRMGSGICVQGGTPRLVHNTLARNTGSGRRSLCRCLLSEATSLVTYRLTNTIIFSHTVGIAATARVTLSR